MGSTIKCICAFLYFTSIASCSKILGVFPSPGYSQFILTERLMVGLAEKGHEVTVICPFAPKESVENYRTVSTAGILDQSPIGDLFGLNSLSAFQSVYITYIGLGYSMTEYTLSAPSVQELLKSNETFDLVIVEQFLNEAHMGFAHHFKAPLVVFNSIFASEWTNFLVGNPAPPSYVPHSFAGYSSEMTFFQSIRNTAMYLYETLFKNIFVLPGQNKLLQKYFPESPNLYDIIANISLVLLNSHPAVSEAFPLVPNMVEIGGFHIAPKPLPKDLQEFLDEAKDGVIFFSMGSNLKSRDLSDELKAGILKAFSKLKQKVLWKFEDDNLPEKPANVKIGKWLPQSSVLAHRNVKAFISHCGFLSSLETVYFGVPVICIPIYGDQKMNSAVINRKGLGVQVNFKELSEKSLSSALDQVLHNDNFRKNMKKNSDMMKDDLVDPLQKAMHWIEFVIKHNGAHHLKCASSKIGWIRYFFLDIILFLIFSTYVLFVILKSLVRKLFSSATKKKVKEN